MWYTEDWFQCICADKPKLIRQDLNPVILRSNPFLNGNTQDPEVESLPKKEPNSEVSKILKYKCRKCTNNKENFYCICSDNEVENEPEIKVIKILKYQCRKCDIKEKFYCICPDNQPATYKCRTCGTRDWFQCICPKKPKLNRQNFNPDT